ncbi:hypothetical protein RDI58_020280 [Solanum bulbocastanum]|uniref:Uncharacterized protein n=1 Tax=Solanum bulbocastanum TaxID=147425 RepID=A0AAN8Y7P2_SOLBU
MANFYAIDYSSCIQVCDVVGFEPGKTHIIVQLEPWIDDGNIQLHYDGVSLRHVCHPIWVTPNPLHPHDPSNPVKSGDVHKIIENLS